MRRKLFNFIAIVSLLLCAATAVPWLRSRAGAGPRFSWGGGLDTGYGYVSRNEIRYQDGSLFYSRVREPLVSLASLGAGPAGRPSSVDLYQLGLHVRRGHWSLAPSRDATPYRCIIWFPGWWLSAAAAVLPSAWLWARGRERRRPRPGCCASCGYDLRATPNRCPECGTAGI